jgi:hypothetical protein
MNPKLLRLLAATTIALPLAGRTYRFRLREPGKAERDADVTFPSTGANEDGYTTRTLTLGQ